MLVPKLKDEVIKALYDEALRTTKVLCPDAEKPDPSIFAGMIAGMYRPIIVNNIQPMGAQAMPGRDFLGRMVQGGKQQ